MATIFPLSASVGQEFEGYIYDGTIWNLIGNEYNPTVYSAYEPDNPKPGDLWVDSSIDVPTFALDDYLTIESASSTYATKTELENVNVDLTGYATETYVQNASAAAVNYLVNGAPAALDTLNELSLALNDDANFATTITNSISEKLSIQSASSTYLTKVDASATYMSIDEFGYPVWNTTSGTIATIYDVNSGSIASISAFSPIGGSVTFSSNNLPTGLSMTPNGLISGNPENVLSTTSRSFDVYAQNNKGLTNYRTFNIIINPANDGSTSARAATNATELYNLGITENGDYWLKGTGTNPYKIYCILNPSLKGGKWMRTASIIRDTNLGNQNWYTYLTGTDYSLANTSSTFNVPPAVFGNANGNDLTVMVRVVGGIASINTPGNMFGAIFKGANVSFAFDDSQNGTSMSGTAANFSYSTDGINFSTYQSAAMTHANSEWNLVMSNNSSGVGFHATNDQTSGWILHGGGSNGASTLYGYLENYGLTGGSSNWNRFEIYIRKD